MNRGIQVYTELAKLAEWSQVVARCRGSGVPVRQWCQDNGGNIFSYYKWQRRVYAAAEARQECRFAEVTPVQPVSAGGIAVTVRIIGAEADIHNGADVATVETVLRILKSC